MVFFHLCIVENAVHALLLMHYISSFSEDMFFHCCTIEVCSDMCEYRMLLIILNNVCIAT